MYGYSFGAAKYVTRYSRKSLRVLGSVGETINPSAWRWFFNIVGDSRCLISDTWWQTKTGGFMHYTAACGGQKLQNAVVNAYAMGKVRMLASDIETATKVI
ncbi:acetyl-coenzyme A synthetase, chloroplastic/glyoxysomal-like isoform X1 [Camellia sinensis]|uniref:acetyl-coenzyme A synthetase, chloroplastic/glyoxysomal-like isoform X1 n=1 Tax=Camellia sinensis TaxID=4442 RepID=UPI0010368AF9|nr:acetyl-coenzyme A synthetase, chloroplastic/glyoxysomal-like isoform X1 [Camellia sinensis]XP_028107000.1 acetyl-coenzyme A synthetase, chloroplastic/glyoxysomal-like isoform X1 [Camellia sinensis]XP_028107001.1 acetyl-coenzyme A synthetase, chloroplastic/glyoxysomal-like isoform X1 [Camellia sinensis]XP_028107002.1 acetyl-coenzyme A synthetase, chloroplastic/glyoxysomal-like isoform X1 [Camellia sinensis]XP_028107003.1 acetyl-coenzyme A synthetase, chloroplastic/glyoxysomal-like isoform X1 